MQVLNEELLVVFVAKHNQATVQLNAWLQVARQKAWKYLHHVKETYPSTDGGVKGIYTVFNIRGNSYRLITLVNYSAQTIAIVHVFTHAEYDKWSQLK